MSESNEAEFRRMAEDSARQRFSQQRDAGRSVLDAAEYALSSMLDRHRSASFVESLSQGTLTLAANGSLLRTDREPRSRRILSPEEVSGQ